ncbi:MAG: hypothetical protein WKH64_15475 [Chloroflexia bacterium]
MDADYSAAASPARAAARGRELPGLHLRTGRRPATVEAALRRAHSLLRFEIRPHITLRETKTLNSRLG